MSYNQQEINKFNEMASEFWNPDGAFKTLHQINPLRLSFIQEYTSLNQQHVIDLGCGGGILSESLAKLGANVTALDLGEEAIGAAKEHQRKSQSTVDYHCMASHDYVATQQTPADVICCMEMLEHVDFPEQIIADCANMVKPGGWVFLSTLNRTLKSRLLAVYTAEYILQMVPKGTHDPNYFIKPSEMANWAKSANLVAKDIRGFQYDFLRDSFTLSNDTDINYIFAFQKQEVNSHAK